MRVIANGRRRFAPVVIAAVLGLTSAVSVAGVAEGATVTRLWQARVGPAGANGTAVLQVFTDRSGSLTLQLAKFTASTTLLAVVSKGTCATVGSTLLVTPSFRTTSAGTVAQTRRLSASQVAPIVAATRSGARLAIRVSNLSTGGVRCGVLAIAPLTIGVVLPTFVQGTTSDVSESTIGTSGYRAQVLHSADVASEKAAVDALIARGVKVLILLPQDRTAVAAADDARAAGVKVIVYDRQVRGTASLDYVVSFDNLATGRAQGQYLVDRAGTTKGNNLYLYAGSSVDDNTYVFLEGAWELLQPRIADGTFVIRNSPAAVGLAANPVLTRDQLAAIVAEVGIPNWDPGTAHARAAADLAALGTAEKGTAFVLAPNDGTALAIWDAFDADLDITTIYITGQDADRAAVQSIIDGHLGVTVLKDHRALWTAATAGAVAYLTGATPVANGTYDNGLVTVPARYLPVVAVTRENLQSVIFNSGYYRAADFSGTWPGKH
jgi:putative multiple sugar transport system substrate-binding protein